MSVGQSVFAEFLVEQLSTKKRNAIRAASREGSRRNRPQLRIPSDLTVMLVHRSLRLRMPTGDANSQQRQ